MFASCTERLATVQCIFENLLKHVEDRYPEIGPLGQKYRTKREMQRIERIERYTKMASGAAVAALGSGPATAIGDARIDAASETPIAQPAERQRGQKTRLHSPGGPMEGNGNPTTKRWI